MTTLSRSRPEELLRCGVLLGRVAEDVAGAITSCRHAEHVRWQGVAAQAYREELAELAERMGRIRRAYDEACDVLVSYSRTLTQAREMCLHAEQLDAQAASEDYLFGVVNPTTTTAAIVLARRAEQLRREAGEMEAAAAGRAAAALQRLTDEAPRPDTGAATSRWLVDAVHGLGDVVGGTVQLVGAALGSLPFVGSSHDRTEAREEIFDAAKEAVQPWLQVEQLLDEVRSHHIGLATGQLAGGLLLRHVHGGSKNAELFGFHDRMPAEVLRAVYRDGHPNHGDDEAWVLAREQRRYLDDLRRLEQIPLPGVGEWIEQGVNLLHHEARGGHTIWKHVGRDEQFLLRRQAAEPGRFGPREISSFQDLDEAQRLVNRALRERGHEISQYFARGGTEFRFSVKLLNSLHGRLIGENSNVIEANYVVVQLVTRDGEVRINSAYLSSRARMLKANHA